MLFSGSRPRRRLPRRRLHRRASVHRIDAEHKQFQADAYGTVQRLELLAAIDRFDDQL
jgi:hypothetical protein